MSRTFEQADFQMSPYRPLHWHCGGPFPRHLHIYMLAMRLCLAAVAARVWSAPRTFAFSPLSIWLRRCVRISNGRHNSNAGTRHQGLPLPFSSKERSRGKATDGGTGKQRGTRNQERKRALSRPSRRRGLVCAVRGLRPSAFPAGVGPGYLPRSPSSPSGGRGPVPVQGAGLGGAPRAASPGPPLQGPSLLAFAPSVLGAGPERAAARRCREMVAQTSSHISRAMR